jgi:hypothetical protein
MAATLGPTGNGSRLSASASPYAESEPASTIPSVGSFVYAFRASHLCDVYSWQ